MGLSLSVLVALCFFLPGATFTLGVRRLHNPSASATLLEQHVSLGLVSTLIAALFFQSVWYATWHYLAALLQIEGPDAAQFVALLNGSLSDPYGRAALGSLREFPLRIVAYFLAIAALAYLLGRSLNRRLRVRHADWGDILRPVGPDFVLVTVDVTLDGSCHLYAGPLATFSLNKDGTLDRVVITPAARKPIRDAGSANGWQPVPGEFLVIQLKDTRTINVDYMYIDPPQPQGESDDEAKAAKPS